ncbi:MAG TPA: adenosylcobinamide amidohydrolase [Acidimicrobiia bacterium]|nr:adenosylcobinamide amidohydrolase [Acidimicrobiia bacterium]
MLVWRLAPPARACASGPLGGGIGERRWVLNAQVAPDFAEVDLGAHLRRRAAAAGCAGSGVGLLTAAPVTERTVGAEDGVVAYATVGLRRPTWAAAPRPATPPAVALAGTINVVAFLPAPLVDAALVNAVMTATEAKSQALVEAGIAGTGTASDAVCVLAPRDGAAQPFGGPRSTLGAPLARAVHAAVRDGVLGAAHRS